MIIKNLKTNLVIAFIFTVISNNLQAQNTAPLDSIRLDSLVSKRVSMPRPGRVVGNYMVKLFSGSKIEADRARSKFDSMGFEWKSNMDYYQPYHEVWVGKFKSKLEANRFINEVRKDFPRAVAVQPRK